jgi:hypothetical protein
MMELAKGWPRESLKA